MIYGMFLSFKEHGVLSYLFQLFEKLFQYQFGPEWIVWISFFSVVVDKKQLGNVNEGRENKNERGSLTQ